MHASPRPGRQRVIPLSPPSSGSASPGGSDSSGRSSRRYAELCARIKQMQQRMDLQEKENKKTMMQMQQRMDLQAEDLHKLQEEMRQVGHMEDWVAKRLDC